MELNEILSRCDHTLLKPECTWEQIREVCDDGLKFNCASVCIPAGYVKQAGDYLGDSLKICTVIGFPNGYSTTAVKVFEAVFADDGDVDGYVKAHGLEQVSDPGAVAGAVEAAFAANPQSVADFLSGKEKAFGFLVGQVMRQLKGRADPKAVNEAVRKKLDEAKCGLDK